METLLIVLLVVFLLGAGGWGGILALAEVAPRWPLIFLEKRALGVPGVRVQKRKTAACIST
jgi:hypothetical protein